MPAHHLSYDVEAGGATPVLFPILQIGVVDLSGNEFYGEFRPQPGARLDPNAMDAIGLAREDVMKYPPASVTAQRFCQWIKDTYKDQRPITWSDNPGFDWQFVNGILWEHCGENPLGFSTRRIGDFYAGLTGKAQNASKWKGMRKTKHTHNALDDARGNLEALEQILAMQKR